jgi:hypothetical protein
VCILGLSSPSAGTRGGHLTADVLCSETVISSILMISSVTTCSLPPSIFTVASLKRRSEPGSPVARIKDILLLFQFRLELGEFLLSVAPNDTLDSLGILLELHSEGFSDELDIKLLVDVGFGQAFLDNELLLRLV